MLTASFKLGGYVLVGGITVVVLCAGILGGICVLRSSKIIEANHLMIQILSQENLAIIPSGQPLRHPQRFNSALSFRYTPALPFDLLESGRLIMHLAPTKPLEILSNADTD
jgi:hypothetical protein